MGGVGLTVIHDVLVALEESAAAHFVEMLSVGGAVSGCVVVSVMVDGDVVKANGFAAVDLLIRVGGDVVVMVSGVAAADLLAGVSGFAAADRVVMMGGHLFEGMGCIVAAAGFVVVVFDTCIFWHVRQYDADLKLGDQFVVYACYGLVGWLWDHTMCQCLACPKGAKICSYPCHCGFHNYKFHSCAIANKWSLNYCL